MKTTTGTTYKANPAYTALMEASARTISDIKALENAHTKENDWVTLGAIERGIENNRKELVRINMAKATTDPWVAL